MTVWRTDKTLKRLHDALPERSRFREVIAEIQRGGTRADRIVPRIQQMAQGIEGGRYTPEVKQLASALLARVGRSKGRPVDFDGGEAKPRITVYPADAAEKETFETAARQAGLSVAAWGLSVMRQAIANKTDS